MTRYEFAWPREIIEVKVQWSYPRIYDDLTNLSDSASGDEYYYMITVKPRTLERILYIGKVFRQHVGQRIRSQDHETRRRHLEKRYGKGSLRIRTGWIVRSTLRRTERLVDEIESILIYDSAYDRNLNRAKTGALSLKRQYLVFNAGNRGPLPKELASGLFVRY